MPLQTNTRLDYLDAVRAFALILGIIFHASLSFMPTFIGWAVMDISTSNVVGIFALISHSFRMELFFLIAGFFAHMQFHKQGRKAFFELRLVRIGIPLFIGWLILRPFLISGWVMGAESMQGDVNILAGLINGFAIFESVDNLTKDFLVGTHLWFLYYLLLISLSVVVIRYFIGLNSFVKHKALMFSDKVIAKFCNSKFAILIIAIPTTCCLWFMDHWGMDTPDKSLLPHIPILLVYGGFFMIGWLMHRQSALIDQFARVTWVKGFLCIFAIIASLSLFSFEMSLAHPQYMLIKASYLFSYAVMMWTLVSLSIGACKLLFKHSNKVLRYISDASYWLYLIHLPIVIWLQIAFAELPMHWAIKLTSICFITFIVSLILYDVFVRATFVGATLNGKKQPRVLFTRQVKVRNGKVRN